MEHCSQFFKELEVDNEQFLEAETLDFGFRATGMLIVIDKGKALEWSFTQGKDLHGKLYKKDSFVVFDWFDAQKIWLRKAPGQKVTVRIWAWVRQR